MKLEKKAKALIGNISKMRLEAPEILDTVFSMLDRDQSGFIEKSEWEGFIGMMEIFDEGDFSEEGIAKLYDYAFDLLDVDGSGGVNFADFLLLMKSAVKAGLTLMEKMVDLGRPLSSAFVEALMKNRFSELQEEFKPPLTFENIFEVMMDDVKDYLYQSKGMNRSYKETKQEMFGGLEQMLPGYKQFEMM